MSDKKPVVYVVQHNHFDPIWRRGWNRTFDFKGQRFRPYSDIEEHVFNVWLENAKQGAVFSEGQAVVFRKYLERNPEKLEEIRRLVNEGKIEITAAGETVADTNMPSGETLLRNYVMGQLYFDDILGVTPKIGWLEDAFGQSAQLPQLFRGVECTSAQRFSYKQVPGDYWKGLDGSVIFKGGVRAPGAGHCIKAPPCPHCDGMGCDECDGLGMDAEKVVLSDEMFERVFGKEFDPETITILSIGGEEAFPRTDIAEVVEKAGEKYGLDLRFGGFGMAAEYCADGISRIDDPEIEVSDQVEANPVSTGCYVTRIKIKQEFRRIENLVNTAERWAAVANIFGADYPAERLTEAWRNVIFVAFHDAITSTHLDQPYYELLDMLADAEHDAAHVMESALGTIEHKIKSDPEKNNLVLFNPESWTRDDIVTVVLNGTCGCPALKDASGNAIEVLDAQAEGEDVHIAFRAPEVPPLGYASVEVISDVAPIDSGDVTKGAGEMENEYYKVKVSERGIDSIFDKRISAEIVDSSKYLANELILEEDIGHPWGTMEMPKFEVGLSRFTTGVRIRKTNGLHEMMLTGEYRGHDNNVKVLSWRQWVRLYKGSDRIDFRTEIDWDTAQRRIRVAFPTNIKKDEAVYSIPYGALERGSYEPDMTRLPSTNGDWPAVNWVDIHDEKAGNGVALINAGTPSHKVKDGVIFMSVLRSPTDSWCLNEPEYYECSDFDGARDAGLHDFFYALIPHQGDYRSANIEKRGREFNIPLIVRLLDGNAKGSLGLVHSFMGIKASDNVIVTALKKAEKDDSVIIRLAETGGMPGEASVSIKGAGNKRSIVNYLERQDKPVADSVKLEPFKIVTVKLEE